MMMDQLVPTIKSIKTDWEIHRLDNSDIKHRVILRLLTLLGWDIFDAEELMVHDHGSDGAAYMLDLKAEPTVEIEFCITSHKDGYRKSHSFGTRLYVQTDGMTWWFHLPYCNGWEWKSVYTVDILYQNPEDVASRFIDFLSRENVDNGDALTNAEAVSKSEQRNLILATLPKAWNCIIEDTDKSLIELISNRAERLCGYTVDAKMVGRFLRENKGNFRISESSARDACSNNGIISDV